MTREYTEHLLHSEPVLEFPDSSADMRIIWKAFEPTPSYVFVCFSFYKGKSGLRVKEGVRGEVEGEVFIH